LLTGTKQCFKCKIVKKLEAFSRSNKTEDGRRARCKECTSSDPRKKEFDRLVWARKIEARKAAFVFQAEKPCIRCHIQKCLKEFPKDPRTFDGYKSVCLMCYWSSRGRESLGEKGRAAAKQKAAVILTAGEKSCVRCNQIKPLTAFWQKSANWNKTHPFCKDCADRPAIRESFKKQRMQNPSKYADIHLRRKYGISLEEYEALLASQDGVCAICKKENTQRDWRLDRPRRMHVDHCHQSGKVRGLLCVRCNNGIGFFRDHPALLTAAIAYLSRSV
jgi:hypothetical protein